MRMDGSVACWGDDSLGQATPPKGEFASVSAGYEAMCGVQADGSVACWGEDDEGIVDFARVAYGLGGGVLAWAPPSPLERVFPKVDIRTNSLYLNVPTGRLYRSPKASTDGGHRLSGQQRDPTGLVWAKAVDVLDVLPYGLRPPPGIGPCHCFLARYDFKLRHYKIPFSWYRGRIIQGVTELGRSLTRHQKGQPRLV